MIISPSVSKVLRGIIHELGDSFKDGLDPVKSGQIDTIIGVLGSCAMRVEYQSSFIEDEAGAIRSLCEKYVETGINSEAIRNYMSDIDNAESNETLYESASNALSAMSDIGSSAGPELSKELVTLLDQRLANEMQIIGGGFEAAGRS